MKIIRINKENISNKIYQSGKKKNISKPSFQSIQNATVECGVPHRQNAKLSFKSAVNAEHYAMESTPIDISVFKNKLSPFQEKLLAVKEIRDFVSDFLRGVNNSKNLTQDAKESIIRRLSYNFTDFIYSCGSYFKTEQEELEAHKPKCSYADIADNNGNITGTAFDVAKKLANVRGSEHYLPNYLKGAKDADGSINSHVGYRVADLVERIGDWDTMKVMKYKIYRDEKGNVNRDLLDKIYSAPKNKTWYVIQHWGLKTEEEVFNENSKENLYLPEKFYKLLQDLNTNKLIYSNEASIMYKEIGDYGTILSIIPDISVNKEAFDKILKFLSSIKIYEYDFNIKDKSGISFMEKVINSENTALVDMIKKMKKKDLIYYPELDWTVSGVQNKDFKEKLKELDFKFDALEKAAKLRSTLAVKKLTPQLDSPLCDKEKMILHLWDIAKESESGMDSKKEFGRYLCETFIDDMSEDTMFKIMNEGVNG